MLPLFFKLRIEAPGLRLGFRHLDREKLMGQMERGEIDLAMLTPGAAAQIFLTHQPSILDAKKRVRL